MSAGLLPLGAAAGVVRDFAEAGVLAAADVHVATRVAALGGEADEAVLLAAALAVRAPRLGHTRVELDAIRAAAAVDAEEEVDVAALPWPEVPEWLARLRRSPLVADGEDAAAGRPLRLVGSALYLDRYWREERRVAADLLALAVPAEGVDEGALARGVERLFPGESGSQQAVAAARAVTRRLSVIAGGPGTGKTTTIARVAALLAEQARAARAPLPHVALVAPTNTAAARLEAAVRGAAPKLDTEPEVREHLAALRAMTVHRLLGRRPGSHSRFRHDRGNRLPHDVVVVDETSMVSLSLMARLVEAVRPAARLVLVGDPGQLTSIEAGVVLGDVVGPDASRAASEVGKGVVVLDRVHRHGRRIGAAADAIRAGDADGAVAALRAAPERITWIEADPAAAAAERTPVRAGVVEAAGAVIEAAQAGDARAALDRLGAYRLLCAHRRGPYGVAAWTDRIELWLTEDLPAFAADGPWYAGRPLLLTENDHALRLYNGDTGVVVRAEGELRAAFGRGRDVVTVRPSRLAAAETVYAMTVHKSQGSQFETTAVVLPPPSSPLLTRELLYTAVTRARERMVLVAEEASVRAAVARPAARASGLGARLGTVGSA